jgi:hypothetical protein
MGNAEIIQKISQSEVDIIKKRAQFESIMARASIMRDILMKDEAAKMADKAKHLLEEIAELQIKIRECQSSLKGKANV